MQSCGGRYPATMEWSGEKVGVTHVTSSQIRLCLKLSICPRRCLCYMCFFITLVVIEVPPAQRSQEVMFGRREYQEGLGCAPSFTFQAVAPSCNLPLSFPPPSSPTDYEHDIRTAEEEAARRPDCYRTSVGSETSSAPASEGLASVRVL